MLGVESSAVTFVFLPAATLTAAAARSFTLLIPASFRLSKSLFAALPTFVST